MKLPLTILSLLIFSMFFIVSCGGGEGESPDTAAADTVITDTFTETGDTATTEESPDADTRYNVFIAALKKDLAASNAYGVSVAVMEKGVVTFVQAFGSKDAEGNVPLTTDTLMQIGSTTKQMTAAALLKKVEAGKLALDDSLEKLLPELEFSRDATWDDQITVHHLLSHQGGFYDWLPWDAVAEDAELRSYTYDIFDEQYFLMNPPGLFWNYSNPNFVFAGLLTETLDARFWSDIMHDDIFIPLGMSRTFLRKSEVEADGDYALSYGLGSDDLKSGAMGDVSMEFMPDPAWGRPAGLVWTTPKQMMLWADFMMQGNPGVLSDELRKKITEEQVTLYGDGISFYGYGQMLHRGYMSKAGDWYKIPVWEHGGNTLSFTNILYMLPEQDFAVCIISSAYDTDFSNSLDAAITTLAGLPTPSTDAPKNTVDPAVFDDHVGIYNDPNNLGKLIISREGDALKIEAPTLSQYGYKITPELTAITSDVFYMYIDGEPFDITFIRTGGSENSAYLRNRIFVAAREKEGQQRQLTRIPSPAEIERFIKSLKTYPKQEIPLPKYIR